MLYILSLLFLALGVYFVCLLEHNRTMRKVKALHEVELKKLRLKIQELRRDSDNTIQAWQAGYKAGTMDTKV